MRRGVGGGIATGIYRLTYAGSGCERGTRIHCVRGCGELSSRGGQTPPEVGNVASCSAISYFRSNYCRLRMSMRARLFFFFFTIARALKSFFCGWRPISPYAPTQDFVLEAARSETGASFGRNAYGNLYQRGEPTPLTVRGKTVEVCEGGLSSPRTSWNEREADKEHQQGQARVLVTAVGRRLIKSGEHTGIKGVREKIRSLTTAITSDSKQQGSGSPEGPQPAGGGDRSGVPDELPI